MKMSGNTILITGGGSGIGRGLAEAFHALGNQVFIAGRRQESLDEVTTANPGMKSYQLYVTSPVGIAALAKKVTDEVAGLNVVIHNSGIMRPEDYTADRVDPQTAEATIATNLLGPIRLTAALLPHLRTQAASTIMTVSSGLAFTPLALTPSYCATKAAIHSWSISLRHQLRDTSVEVLELAPPYVQTELMGPHQANDPHAMPLDDFISEVMQLIEAGPTHGEILVQRVMNLRNSEASGNFWGEFERLNTLSHRFKLNLGSLTKLWSGR